MRHVFADAVYWVALTHRKDQWHSRAVAVSQQLGTVELVTTDEVLDEFLAYFSGFGPLLRQQTAASVRSLLAGSSTRVIPQSRASFLAGLDLYENRPDKAYSLTDCISMAVMRQEGLTEVLTHDVHFTQEGFRILL
jgi:predicted nucleic acid-binding protein